MTHRIAMNKEARALMTRAEHIVRAAVTRACDQTLTMVRVSSGWNRLEDPTWVERTDFDLVNQLAEVQLAFGYAEPGYGSDGQDIIAFGNWNPIGGFNQSADSPNNLPCRVSDLLEKAGVTCEWSDEWETCDDCGRAYRRSGDSYGWTPSYVDGTCEDCVLEDPEEYLEGLEGNHHTAVTLDVDPASHGYVKVNSDSFERGWHPGQADNPEMIATALEKYGIERYLFRIDSVGQFDARFSVFVHPDFVEEYGYDTDNQLAVDAAIVMLRDYLSRADTSDDVDPGTLMAQALQSIPVATVPGIQVVKVHADGTSTSKQVSRQDFIDGPALD